MGFKCSRMCNDFFPNKITELRIGLFGLSNSGKTTILYQLKLGHNIEAKPTVGFNVETISFENTLINIWEVAGIRQGKTHTLWKHYNENVNAIIFVVDSADQTQLAEAFDTLQWICWQPKLAESFFLVYANKQDLPGALRPIDLVKLFQLPTLLPNRKWTLQPCCALSGVGLHEGLYNLLNLHKTNAQNKQPLCHTACKSKSKRL